MIRKTRDPTEARRPSDILTVLCQSTPSSYTPSERKIIKLAILSSCHVLPLLLADKKRFPVKCVAAHSAPTACIPSPFLVLYFIILLSDIPSVSPSFLSSYRPSSLQYFLSSLPFPSSIPNSSFLLPTFFSSFIPSHVHFPSSLHP